MNFIEIGEYIFPTALALSDEEHSRGLMFVKQNPPVMSFVYAKAGINKMWMKNTYIPLDILFCRNGKIIALAQGTPFSEEIIGPNVITDLVVEMPAGSIEEFTISVGDSVQMTYTTQSLARKITARYHLG
jgi:uncharacterized membrane protein (UPF0127 family)